jgi:hypothetical protein
MVGGGVEEPVLAEGSLVGRWVNWEDVPSSVGV